LKILNSAYEASQSVIGSCTATLVSFYIGTNEQIELRGLNLGDSGFLLLRQLEGKLGKILKTKEQQHKFNMPFQLGSYSDDRPEHGDVYREDLEKGDIIIVGTDGLWDNLFEEDIIHIIASFQSTTSSQQMAKSIANAALTASENPTRLSPFMSNARKEFKNNEYNGGKEDDITVLVAKVTNSLSSKL